MLRNLFTSLLLLLLVNLQAQTSPENQSVSLDGIDHVTIQVSFSSVLLQTSNTATLEVQHIFTVDGEPEPALRELAIERNGRTLSVKEIKPNMKGLEKMFPKGFTSNNGDVMNGDYHDGAHYDKHDKDRPVVEARLVITLPASVTVDVETVYGSITAKGISGLKRAYAEYGSVVIDLNGQQQQGQLELGSHYGAVDLSLPANAQANLKLITDYGELFSDFDIKIDESASKEEDFHQEVIGKLGSGGRTISCNAPYGNVYLRKGK